MNFVMRKVNVIHTNNHIVHIRLFRLLQQQQQQPCYIKYTKFQQHVKVLVMITSCYLHQYENSWYSVYKWIKSWTKQEKNQNQNS